VASEPAGAGNLPGDYGYKLQGMALELRNAAQINGESIERLYYLIYFLF
jgi:hypothetical protein